MREYAMKTTAVAHEKTHSTPANDSFAPDPPAASVASGASVATDSQRGDESSGVPEAPASSGVPEAPARESRSRLLSRILAAAVGGLLLFAAFPPLDWWFCAPVGLALTVLSLYGCRPRRALWIGYVGALVFLLPTLAWVRPIGYDAWVGLVALESLFYAVLAAGVVMVVRLPCWPLWFGALWVAMEWARSLVPIGGFPWARVAFSQGESPYTQYAALGGAPLVSFAVATSGGLLALLVIKVARGRSQRASGSSG